jgi:hypothetical protein
MRPDKNLEKALEVQGLRSFCDSPKDISAREYMHVYTENFTGIIALWCYHKIDGMRIDSDVDKKKLGKKWTKC